MAISHGEFDLQAGSTRPDPPPAEDTHGKPDALADAASTAAQGEGHASDEVSARAFRNLVLQQLHNPGDRRWAIHAAAPPVREEAPTSDAVEALRRWYRAVSERLSEPEIGGGLLVAMAAMAFVVLLSPLTGPHGAVGDFVGDTFGLLTIAIPVALGAAGLLVVAERGDELPRYLRSVAGAAILAVFTLGLLRIWLPERDLWGLDVATVTAGGNLGVWFTTSFIGFPVWLAVGIVGFAIAAPEHAERVAQTAPPVLRRVALRMGDRTRRLALRISGTALRPLRATPTSSAARRSAQASRARAGARLGADGWQPAGRTRAGIAEAFGDAEADAGDESRRQFHAGRRGAEQAGMDEPTAGLDASMLQLQIALGQRGIEAGASDAPAPSSDDVAGYSARWQALAAAGVAGQGASTTPGFKPRRRRVRQPEPKRAATTVPALTVLLLALSIGVGWVVRSELQQGAAQEAPAVAGQANDGAGVPVLGAQVPPAVPDLIAEGGEAVVRAGGGGVWLYTSCQADARGNGLLADGTRVEILAAGSAECGGWALVDVPERGVQTWVPLDVLSRS